jgi:glycosyltransferase involved in cell wall biosynthesis
MAALVSIIIPFYNEERYLEKAAQSVLEQPYKDIELILVDDGSTDRSPAIAQALSSRHANVVLVTIPNSGPGLARNAGMARASGAYLTFLDSDDILLPEAIGTWVRKITESGADIVISRFRAKNATRGTDIVTGWKGEGSAGSGADGVAAMYEYRMASTVWGKLYRTDIMKTLRFPEGSWFEDRYFLLSYFLKARRIVFEESAGLEVLSRKDSLTRRLLSEHKIKDAHRVYLLELELVRDHMLRAAFIRLLDRHQVNALIETLIILYYDKAQLKNRKALEHCLSAFIAAFIRQVKQNGTQLGVRDQLDLLLLRLHRIAGWTFTYALLPWWKRKKCRAVLALKSS